MLDRKLLELKPAYQQKDRGSGSHRKQSQSASNRWPSGAGVSGDRNQLLAEKSILSGGDNQSGGSEAELIGQDLWKQLKRVSIPIFQVISKHTRIGRQPLWLALTELLQQNTNCCNFDSA